MYAPRPFFEGERVWHKVHPLTLYSAVCNSRTVLNCNMIRDELPEESYYCAMCAARQHFVAALEW